MQHAVLHLTQLSSPNWELCDEKCWSVCPVALRKHKSQLLVQYQAKALQCCAASESAHEGMSLSSDCRLTRATFTKLWTQDSSLGCLYAYRLLY